MIVLYVSGYFNRNKQNSYAALTYGIYWKPEDLILREGGKIAPGVEK